MSLNSTPLLGSDNSRPSTACRLGMLFMGTGLIISGVVQGVLAGHHCSPSLGAPSSPNHTFSPVTPPPVRTAVPSSLAPTGTPTPLAPTPAPYYPPVGSTAGNVTQAPAGGTSELCKPVGEVIGLATGAFACVTTGTALVVEALCPGTVSKVCCCFSRFCAVGTGA